MAKLDAYVYVIYKLGSIQVSSGGCLISKLFKQNFFRGKQIAPKTKLMPNYASLPVGKKGWELKNPLFQPIKNPATTINGRQYTGHAIDQMQNRGIFPSAVENTIKNGLNFTGKQQDTQLYYVAANNISVIVNKINEIVITTTFGQIIQ